MEIKKYDVILQRLTADKCEMVRNWRNDPKISRYMEYQEYITPEMQMKWFEKINNDQNYYFIIVYDKKEIGLINVKDIDAQNRTGEEGIFIYDDDYLNSDISFRSSLAIDDFCFEDLQLEKIWAHIRKDNKRAITYNQLFGFKLQENQENILNQLYALEKEEYFKKRERIKNILG